MSTRGEKEVKGENIGGKSLKVTQQVDEAIFAAISNSGRRAASLDYISNYVGVDIPKGIVKARLDYLAEVEGLIGTEVKGVEGKMFYYIK